jgi:SpoU rRNA methylase family enzyme
MVYNINHRCNVQYSKHDYIQRTHKLAFTMAITTARIHQAVSSAAAQVITIVLILFYECRVPAQFLPKLEETVMLKST